MARESIVRPTTFTRCYGCGKDNPRGLGMEFARDGEAVVATWSPGDEHGGFGQLVHGGVIATVLDEAIGWAVYALLGETAVTTELSVRYQVALLCGRPITVRAEILERDPRVARVSAQIADEHGAIAAVGTGRMRLVSRRALERLGRFRTD